MKAKMRPVRKTIIRIYGNDLTPKVHVECYKKFGSACTILISSAKRGTLHKLLDLRFAQLLQLV
jgi:hypothetical protein